MNVIENIGICASYTDEKYAILNAQILYNHKNNDYYLRYYYTLTPISYQDIVHGSLSFVLQCVQHSCIKCDYYIRIDHHNDDVVADIIFYKDYSMMREAYKSFVKSTNDNVLCYEYDDLKKRYVMR